MKGILLAGGFGTRLYPLTSYISKQLLPVYDKPAIYYPLSALMLAGIKEIMIISTKEDIPCIKKLLKDGSQLGMQITYCIQEKPEGIAQAFLLGADFIGNSSVCLILGDNLFYAQDLHINLEKFLTLKEGAGIFAYHVGNPSAYGIVEFDKNMKAISLEEKPINPKTSWAVPGLYFYDNQVVSIAKSIKPSLRNELEITDVNKVYLKKQQLTVKVMGRGVTWLDLGTPDALLSASSFVQTIEKRQNLQIGCVEEIAFRMGFIDIMQLNNLAQSYPNGSYKNYLIQTIEDCDYLSTTSSFIGDNIYEKIII